MTDTVFWTDASQIAPKGPSVRYRSVTSPPSRGVPLRSLFGATLLAAFSPVLVMACGWWGDGEMDRDDGAVIVGANGQALPRRPAREDGTAYEVMTKGANALRNSKGASPQEIARIYLVAAAGGFAPAQNSLGNLYEQGLGVSQSDFQAAYWYQRAAEQGEPRAQHSLGTLYLQGRGVPRDLAKGEDWLRRSLSQGHAAAGTDLGHLYWRGEGMPRDKTHALAWWLIGAGSGDRKSSDLSKDAKRRMTEEEIAAAERMVRSWTRQGR